jgi:hypothetical protein
VSHLKLEWGFLYPVAEQYAAQARADIFDPFLGLAELEKGVIIIVGHN